MGRRYPAATSYTINSFSAGTTHSFEVQAANTTGDGALSTCTVGSTTSVPSSPTGLQVFHQNATALTLTWNQPPGVIVNDTLYWNVGYTCTGATYPNTISTNGSNSASFNASIHTSYVAKVQAWNLTGGSPKSACLLIGNTPSAPTNFNVVDINTTAVNVSWTNPPGTVSNLSIFYIAGTGCANFNQAVNIPGNATTYHIFSSLSGGSPYSFRVRAYNATGAGAATGCKVVYTGGVPAAPTGLTLVSGNGTRIAASWTNPTTGGLTNVSIFVSTGNCTSTIGIINATFTLGVVTTTLIYNVTLTTFYNVSVYVWNATGHGPAACGEIETAGGGGGGGGIVPPVNLAEIAVLAFVGLVVLGAVYEMGKRKRY